MRQKIRSRAIPIAATAMLTLSSIPAWAVNFNQINLVTDDQAANPAKITDPSLKNAWGMSFGPANNLGLSLGDRTPFSISANGSGVSNLYNVNPVSGVVLKQSLIVTIPGAGNVTGQVYNDRSSTGYYFNGDFLFVSKDGTISTWDSSHGTDGSVAADTFAGPTPGKVYTGAGISSPVSIDAYYYPDPSRYLYAANFKAGTVDVYGVSGLPGSFTDPNLPAGYAPFNVQNLNDKVYVAYAERDDATNDAIKGAGKGFISKFDLFGRFIERVVSNGELNAPWGLAIAPASFGSMAGELLVGNFGDGHINIYASSGSHAHLGQILDASNQPLVIDGLHAIGPGNGTLAGKTDLLYFTAGPGEGTHGLFGVLAPVPEPFEYAMMLVGLGVVLLLGRRGEASGSATNCGVPILEFWK